MKQRSHGGDWVTFAREYGAKPLDFSANVSPLGVPEGALRAIERAAREADRYPDPACRALRQTIAAHEGVPEPWAICSAGASDLIYRAVFAAKPRRVLVTAPCFGEYEAAAEAAGCALIRYPLDEDFRLDEGVLDALHGVDFAFFCQPNNPSGVAIAPALLRKILAQCEKTGCRVLVDECFAGFFDDPEQYRMQRHLAEYPQLLILDAFTKLYALAGARVGWALCADTAFLDAMRRAGPPWSVSQLAQAAGVAALADTDYVARLRALIRRERPWLFARLTELGLFVVPGMANFLLFRCQVPLDKPMRTRGILLRACADYAGLDDHWYRVAVRTHPENARLIETLREVLA